MEVKWTSEDGKDEIKEGDSVVGAMDWSRISEFKRLNGELAHKDMDVARKMIKDLKEALERKAVVVCVAPKRSQVWKLKNMKDLKGMGQIMEGTFDGCKWEFNAGKARNKKGKHWQNEMMMISNSEDMIAAMKGRCDESGKHLGNRGVKEK